MVRHRWGEGDASMDAFIFQIYVCTHTPGTAHNTRCRRRASATSTLYSLVGGDSMPLPGVVVAARKAVAPGVVAGVERIPSVPHLGCVGVRTSRTICAPIPERGNQFAATVRSTQSCLSQYSLATARAPGINIVKSAICESTAKGS